jgi:hypothetical protein
MNVPLYVPNILIAIFGMRYLSFYGIQYFLIPQIILISKFFQYLFCNTSHMLVLIIG